MTEALLELRGLTKRYGALLVTDDVDLSVRPGSIHAIIGPNGAGKTSLIHQISGIVRADAGHVLLDGRDITRLALHRRARLGLARGFQITSVLPEFSVLENVALAAQAKAGSPFRFIRPAARETALNQQAHACLARVGLEARQADPARRLSHGEKRQLELAIALAARPRVLLLDEPLAGAGPAETARLVALLDSLRRDCAIVLVEHDMDAVFALADTISVLAQGRVIASGVPAAIRADAAVRVAYLGEPGLMLEVTRLQSGYGETQVLFDVSLSVGAGEVVTLLGRNGMGKTTTIRTIMGLLPARGGSIAVDNQAILGWPSFRIARLGLGLVPEGRQVFPTLTVEENLVATSRPGSWTTAAVFDLFPRLHERRAQMARLMSGGEQQMLAIGRALMTNPRLLILDEATEGLAPLVRAEIWACLARLKAERLAILLIDKTLDALMRFADRHVIIEKGVTMWSGSSAELAAASDVRERYLHL